MQQAPPPYAAANAAAPNDAAPNDALGDSAEVAAWAEYCATAAPAQQWLTAADWAAAASATAADSPEPPRPLQQTGRAGALIALTHLRVLQVSGEAAESFLQGQLSSDVTALAVGQAQLSAYCTPKGRTLSVFWLLRQAQGFDLLLPAETSDKLLARLQLYVLRAKVTLHLAPRVAVGLSGLHGDLTQQQAEHLLGGLLGGSEAVPIALAPGARYVCLMAATAAIELFSQAPPDVARGTYDVWRLLDIRAGCAWVAAATFDTFIPQSINLDLSHAISFTKGCYAGQEIIARLRYLGKLKHRCVRAEVRSTSPLSAATPIFSPHQPDAKVGVVVDAVPIGEGDRYEMLVMLPSEQIEHGDLAVGSAAAALLTRLPLPYEVSVEKPKGREKV